MRSSGIAAVGGDHDIKGFGSGAHGDITCEGASESVLGEELSCMDAGDAMCVVHGHVDAEAHTRVPGDASDGVVDGVALGDGPCGVGVADEGGGVELHDSVDASEAGGDHLGAAAETGEEVGLDKSEGYADVGLHPASVEEDRYSIDGWGGVDEGVGIETVVANDGIVPYNLLAEHPL